MNIKNNIKLHNKFVIEVRDAETNELKQTATSYNIILDALYTRLCAGSTYFVNIHFGTGTGTLSPSRTSLFTHLGTKAAVNEYLVKAVPNSSWTRKITLNPEEFVGSTIREVGIAFGTTNTNLVTHSLLSDDEGNTLEITKSDTDVLIIYATVFVVFDVSNPSLKWLSFPNNNTLANYLVGGATAPTGVMVINDIRQRSTNLGQTATVTWSANASLKTRSTPVTRFGTTVGNGHIKYFEFPGIFSLELPASSVYSGTPYSGVILGVGDGVKTSFKLLSRNVRANTVVIRKDGTVDNAYTISDSVYQFAPFYPEDTTTQFTSINIASEGRSASFSDDGNKSVLAISVAPFVVFYERTNNFWTSVPIPITFPSDILGVALSGDGGTIAVTVSASNQLYIYRNIGGSWQSYVITMPIIAFSYTTNNTNRAFSYVSIDYDGDVIFVNAQTDSYIYSLSGAEFILEYSVGLSSSGVGGISRQTNVLMHSSGQKAIFYQHGAAIYLLTKSEGVWSRELMTGGVGDSYSTSYVFVTRNFDYLFASSSSFSGTAARLLASISGSVFTRIETSLFDTGGTSNNNGSIIISEDGTQVFGSTYGLRQGPPFRNTPMLAAHYLNAFAGYPYFSTDKSRLTYFTREGNLIELILLEAPRSIIFDTPPTIGTIITANYTVDGIHKTDQYVIDASFSIQFGEDSI